MKSDRCRGLVGVAVVFSFCLAACGETQTEGSGGGAASTGSGEPFAGCVKGKLESDLVTDPPLTGPGVDAKTHALAKGHYTVAATYLAIAPAEAKHAFELGGDVVKTLPTMKGLVAFSLATSSSCQSLRTLTVWESEEDMTSFVASPAHAKAMGQFSTLSRGTSDVTAWSGDEADASFLAGASHLAKTPGNGR